MNAAGGGLHQAATSRLAITEQLGQPSSGAVRRRQRLDRLHQPGSADRALGARPPQPR